MPSKESTPTTPAPAAPAPESFQVHLDQEYVVTLSGGELQLVREALDLVGRNLGADRGQIPWGIRARITAQMEKRSEAESHAAGLIAGREAQRAAAKTEALNKDAAEATAAKTASRKKK